MHTVDYPHGDGQVANDDSPSAMALAARHFRGPRVGGALNLVRTELPAVVLILYRVIHEAVE